MSQRSEQATHTNNILEQILIKPSHEVRQDHTDEAAGCTGKCVSGMCRTLS